MGDYRDNAVDAFLQCIYGKDGGKPIEEKYVAGDVKDAHLFDYNVIVESGDVNFFRTIDKVLSVVGMQDVVVTDVPITELHFYDDWPKSSFSGQGKYATVQFNTNAAT